MTTRAGIPDSSRIGGIDLARALAMFGMLAVNFRLVAGMGTGDAEWLLRASTFVDGKAAALFVIVAGIGITLLGRRNDARRVLLKRAGILLIGGLAFYPIWPGDILHYYGLYIAIAACFLPLPRWALLAATFTVSIAFVVLLLVLNFDTHWDWSSLTYRDFWTIDGLLRHTFFNGIHPVFPWVGFMLFGMWLGRLQLSDPTIRRRLLVTSLSVLAFSEGCSLIATRYLEQHYPQAPAELVTALVGTSPIPPLPIYLLSAGSFALLVLLSCLYISDRFSASSVVRALRTTGRLSLTVYLAHVLVGMTLLLAFTQGSERKPPPTTELAPATVSEFELPTEVTVWIESSTTTTKHVETHDRSNLVRSQAFAGFFWIAMIAFSVLWTRRYRHGPAEWVLRRLSQ